VTANRLLSLDQIGVELIRNNLRFVLYRPVSRARTIPAIQAPNGLLLKDGVNEGFWQSHRLDWKQDSLSHQ
jgi:hypothetical protein